ncbi:MAG: hypothetical protein ABWY34_11080 [Pseudoxanthomonas sp.]
MRFFFAPLLSLSILPAFAATYPVDDSGSQVLDTSLNMKWDSVVPQSGQQSGVTGVTTVLVRLNTAQWKGRQGRIYMTLPEQPAGAVVVTWATRGTLLPGALRSGERTLVYGGALTGEVLEDTLRLSVQADGRRLTRTEQLRFSFEIDLETP